VAPNSILDKAKSVSCLTCRDVYSNSSPPVQTAKQSCELLLKVQRNGTCLSGLKTNFPQIIDSILDYSKLEASGVLSS